MSQSESHGPASRYTLISQTGGDLGSLLLPHVVGLQQGNDSYFVAGSLLVAHVRLVSPSVLSSLICSY